MNQDTRVLIAFALSFAVLLLWQAVFVKTPAKGPSSQAKPAAQGGAKQVPAQAAAKPSPPKPVPVLQGSRAEEIVIEGALYRVTLSTEGAVVKSWILKKYHDEKENPLEVVNRAACEQMGYPMSVNVTNPSFSAAENAALTRKLNSALYVAKPEGATLTAPVKVELVYSDGSIQARKEFSFGPGYEMHVEASVSDGRRYLPVEAAWPGGFGDYTLPPKVREARSQAVYGSPGSFTVLAEKKINEERAFPGPLEVAGLEDLYFVDVFLPDSPAEAFRVLPRTWSPPDWKEKEPAKELEAFLATPEPRPLGFRLFVAPKDLDVLRAANPPLDDLVNFGWFSFVAKPLFLGLRYIYEHWVHNWGWAIVLLTFILNFLLFPLKLKSIRSAQEMQKIAPQVKSIQEKYKQYKFNDPRKQRMNQEIMKLYQEHGVNPLGGCLPMLLQLPLLYGFYELLLAAIELRHAPWIGCVTDLSMPDKCYLAGIHVAILPTVMIATMFLLQKMTPMATADPAQQRMMFLMPLIFGVIFYNLASGLVLYYLTANVVGIAQQWFINRMVPAAQPVPAGRKTANAKN